MGRVYALPELRARGAGGGLLRLLRRASGAAHSEYGKFRPARGEAPALLRRQSLRASLSSQHRLDLLPASQPPAHASDALASVHTGAGGAAHQRGTLRAAGDSAGGAANARPLSLLLLRCADLWQRAAAHPRRDIPAGALLGGGMSVALYRFLLSQY